jgi:sarcosine oxidase delta subunit
MIVMNWPNTDNNLIDCPQCGYPAERVKFIIGGEITVNCPYCGYYSSSGTKGTKEFIGRGTVHNPGMSRRIEENEIIDDDLIGNYVAVYTWDKEKKKLITRKGDVPKTLDQLCEEAIAQQEWDNICRMSSNHDLTNVVPFGE